MNLVYALRPAGALIVVISAISFTGCGGGGSPQSITVSPSSVAVGAGSVVQYTALKNNSDGSTSDITGTATWSTSNSAAVSISATGSATAMQTGASQITAASGSLSGTSGMTVDLLQLSISPSNPSLPTGQTLQFNASAFFLGGLNQDATTAVAWSSSNTAVATISNTGLVHAVAAGTVTITALSGNISASTQLTVQ